VLAGRDKGKVGDVMRVIRKDGRALVQGVNVAKRHTRPSQTNPGGIVDKEMSIHMSNLSHIDPKDDRATKVGFKKLEDGRKVRFAKRSGEVIDR
jgi:large subunit ribosomal protein L24